MLVDDSTTSLSFPAECSCQEIDSYPLTTIKLRTTSANPSHTVFCSLCPISSFPRSLVSNFQGLIYHPTEAFAFAGFQISINQFTSLQSRVCGSVSDWHQLERHSLSEFGNADDSDISCSESAPLRLKQSQSPRVLSCDVLELHSFRLSGRAR